jgi:iron complex transport system ATP-binding protein
MVDPSTLHSDLSTETDTLDGSLIDADQAILRTRRVSLSYGDRPIVSQLSMTIPRGKITALVGANGSGKSTLLKGLARLLKPQGGMVYLNGQAIAKLPTKEIAKQMGILPQSPASPEGLTVHDLVSQGRYPHQRWFQQWSSEDADHVQKALHITRMEELRDRPLDALSGGQRQRAWIAMSLAQNTPILLLDEPTTYLDLAHQMEVLDLLKDLNQTQNRTIVMVLHDLNHACRYADYLVALKEGAIAAQGHPAQVMTEEMVQTVFQLISRIIPDPITGTPMCIPIRKYDVSPSGIAGEGT